eukprot:COSAG06_NODE_27706_length_588_cov_0.625767_2_plen_77_part_01
MRRADPVPLLPVHILIVLVAIISGGAEAGCSSTSSCSACTQQTYSCGFMWLSTCYEERMNLFRTLLSTCRADEKNGA